MIKTVQKIDITEGAKNGRPWRKWTFTFTDATKAGTFDETAAAVAPVGSTRDFELEQEGQYTNIKSVKEAPKEAVETAQGGKPDWEAKDRRIAMESAYASAARFYQHREGGPKDVARLARAMYRDIQTAGENGEFPALKDA